MEKWKCCVEELSSVIAQITQGQMISAVSALLIPVNTYLTAFSHCPHTTAGSAQPKAASTAALQRS